MVDRSYSTLFVNFGKTQGEHHLAKAVLSKNQNHAVLKTKSSGYVEISRDPIKTLGILVTNFASFEPNKISHVCVFWSAGFCARCPEVTKPQKMNWMKISSNS